MVLYKYKGLTEDGHLVKGSIEESSEKEARNRLKEQGVITTELKRYTGIGKFLKSLDIAQIFLKFARVKDLAVITRQLSAMLKAGLPLLPSLDAIIEQSKNKGYAKILQDVRNRTAEGLSFSEALSKYPNIFDNLYINMVKAGEKSGSLSLVLYRLSEYLLKQNTLRNKLLTSLTYPIIMIFVSLAVVIVLLTYVVPKVTAVLMRNNQTLPLTTQILIESSKIISTLWPFIALAFIISIIAFQKFRKTEKGGILIDSILIKIPVVGELILKSSLARFAHTFSVLLDSGIPALESLRVSANVTKNNVMMNAINKSCERIVEGQNISTTLKTTGLFPPVVTHMIAVGEQSGQLSDLLKMVSQAFEEDVDLASQRFLSVIEPLIVVFMAVVVGFIVLAVILPVLEMSSVL